MRIGFDVDGVLAHFEAGYERTIVQVTGRNLFPWLPGRNKPGGSPVWDWPQHFGYTADDIKRAWDEIKSSPDFWVGLPECPGIDIVRLMLPDLKRNHDTYYITNRVGVAAKWQTELWLEIHLGDDRPTVLLSPHKGTAAKALSLDVYVDDNYDNVCDVATESPKTRTYLLDADYNRLGALPAGVTRVERLEQMFDAELRLDTL